MTFNFVDYRDETIQLSEEVYNVVLTKHPEAEKFVEQVGETLASPDIIKRSQTDARVNLYYKFYSHVLNGKFVVIVAKFAQEYFVSTFYATDKIKKEKLYGRRNNHSILRP